MEDTVLQLTAQKMKFSVNDFFSKCVGHIYRRNP